MELGLSTIGRSLAPEDLAALGPRVENLGYGSIWTAEAWGEGPISTLIVEPTSDDAIEQVAEIWASM